MTDKDRIIQEKQRKTKDFKRVIAIFLLSKKSQKSRK
jgi:hypothetical protein